jgi:hypothetical protein
VVVQQGVGVGFGVGVGVVGVGVEGHMESLLQPEPYVQMDSIQVLMPVHRIVCGGVV